VGIREGKEDGACDAEGDSEGRNDEVGACETVGKLDGACEGDDVGFADSVGETVFGSVGLTDTVGEAEGSSLGLSEGSGTEGRWDTVGDIDWVGCCEGMSLVSAKSAKSRSGQESSRIRERKSTQEWSNTSGISGSRFCRSWADSRRLAGQVSNVVFHSSHSGPVKSLATGGVRKVSVTSEGIEVPEKTRGMASLSSVEAPVRLGLRYELVISNKPSGSCGKLGSPFLESGNRLTVSPGATSNWVVDNSVGIESVKIDEASTVPEKGTVVAANPTRNVGLIPKSSEHALMIVV